MLLLLGIVALAGVLMARNATCQQSEEERRLEIEKAEVSERLSEASSLQIKRLYDEGLASRFELSRVQAEYEKARIETRRLRAALVNELPPFRVLSAVKEIGADGVPRVTVALEELGPRDGLRATEYLVSLTSNGVAVGVPYEHRVRSGPKVLRLEFALLRDVDEATIQAETGSRRHSVSVLLSRHGGSKPLALVTSGFSQEGSVGDRVEYAMQLERFRKDVGDVLLDVEGLPEGFVVEWFDVESKAKVGAVRFGEGQTRMRLSLRVFVPSKAETEWLEKPTSFKVRATSAGGGQLDSVSLVLKILGLPRLVVSTDELLVKLGAGSNRDWRIWVENTAGTEARNLSWDVVPPPGFEVAVEPPVVPLVRPRDRVAAVLRMTLDAQVVPGEYSVRVVARTKARQTSVESQELLLRVSVNEPRAVMWFIIAVGVLGGGAGVLLLTRRREASGGRSMRAGVFMLLTLLVAGTALSDAPTRTGVVDVDRVVGESAFGKESLARLQKLQGTKQEELTKRQKDLKDLEQKIQDQGKSLSEEAMDKAQKEYQAKAIELKRFQDDTQRELEEAQRKELAELEKRVLPVIKQVGKEQGFALVFNKFRSGLLDADDSVDITDAVITKFNSQITTAPKAEAKPAAKPPAPAPAKK